MTPVYTEPTVADGKRRRFRTKLGLIYCFITDTSLSATIPRENWEERRTLRQFVDKVCDNAPHRDWRGREQFYKDVEHITKKVPEHAAEELAEVLGCICTMVEEYYKR